MQKKKDKSIFVRLLAQEPTSKSRDTSYIISEFQVLFTADFHELWLLKSPIL